VKVRNHSHRTLRASASTRLTLGLPVASVKILDIPPARCLESQRTALVGHQLTVTNDGYVMNDLDWRVRSPRALALCSALYECEPVRSV
jgi:hypothetical protein